MNDLFVYLHLLNEARSIESICKNDQELSKRIQRVCDAIEEALEIRECKEEKNPCCGQGHFGVNNYYTTNNYNEPNLAKVLNKPLTREA